MVFRATALVLFTLVAAAAACSGVSADLQGMWYGSTIGDHHQTRITIKFTQNAGDLGGTFAINTVSGSVNGEIEGDFLRGLFFQSDDNSCQGSLIASGLAGPNELGIRFLSGDGCLVEFVGQRAELIGPGQRIELNH
jgi:hypothetical protein